MWFHVSARRAFPRRIAPWPLAAGLAACLVVADLARARAEGSEGAVSLALEDALARASERAPEVIYGRHVLRDAEARRVGAGIVLPTNPRLSFDVRPVLRGGPQELGYAANGDLLFEPFGAPAARLNEARRYADVAEAELRVRRLEVKAATWAAYVRALVAEQRLRELNFAMGIAERVLGASKQRAEAGAAGDIEQSLAQSEVAQLKAALVGVARDRERFVMFLRDALDLPAAARVTLTTPLAEPGDVPPAEALSRRAVEARADLEAIRRRIDVLVATEERLAREVRPRIGGYLGVDAAPLSPIFGVVGLTVELPVAQRNQGPLARTAAQKSGEMERLEVEARRIVRDVVAARGAYEARRSELRLLTEGALPTAERTLDLVETGWRSGRFDIFRVTAAARDVVRVRGLRLDAMEAAWLERITLDRAAGGLGQ